MSVLPPVNYNAPSRLVQWFMARRGKEFDTYTGFWVPKGWIVERQRLMDQHFATGEHLEGTCIDCNQPMALHPRARAWTRDPAMCPR